MCALLTLALIYSPPLYLVCRLFRQRQIDPQPLLVFLLPRLQVMALLEFSTPQLVLPFSLVDLTPHLCYRRWMERACRVAAGNEPAKCSLIRAAAACWNQGADLTYVSFADLA